jgi:hypothetical protein
MSEVIETYYDEQQVCRSYFNTDFKKKTMKNCTLVTGTLEIIFSYNKYVTV